MTLVPPALAARRHDERRGLPIPYVNEMDDGTFDFTAINGGRSLECARRRLCGLCAEPIGYWVAFMGGPQSIRLRSFTDPPMHRECATAARELCPHIAIARHKRVPEHRVRDDVGTPAGWIEDKPSEFWIGMTRTYEITLRDGYLIYLPAPWKTIHRFEKEVHDDTST